MILVPASLLHRSFLVLALGGLSLLTACDQTADAELSATTQVPAATSLSTEVTDLPMTHEAEINAYRAQGNEPFWTVELLQDQMRYVTPENLEGIELQVEEFSADAEGVSYAGSYQNEPFNLVIQSVECQDTMVERSYEFTAVFNWQGEALQGCASRWED